MTDTLHYTIVPPLADSKLDTLNEAIRITREFGEWMAGNFDPLSYTYNRYKGGSGSVLFSSLDQVFLTRLRWHDVMRPVV